MGKATFVVLLALFAATLAKPHNSLRDQNESPVEYLLPKGVQLPYEFNQLYNYNQVPEVNLAPYFEAQRREFPRILYPPFVSFPKELYDQTIEQRRSTDDREADVLVPLEKPASTELFDENQKPDDIANKRNPEIPKDNQKPSSDKPREASEDRAAPVTNDKERGNASDGKRPNEDQLKDGKDIEKPQKPVQGQGERKKDTPHHHEKRRPNHGSHSPNEREDKKNPDVPRPRSHEKDTKEGVFGEDSKFQPSRPSPQSAVARPRGPPRKAPQPQPGNPGKPEPSLVQINVNIISP